MQIYSHVQRFVMSDLLKMLSVREQLMEDIDCIVESELSGIISDDLSNELVRRLCDAVCRNFPAQ